MLHHCKRLRPNDYPAPERTWESQKDPQRMQHKHFQASNLGSHAKFIAQKGIKHKVEAFVTIPIL